MSHPKRPEIGTIAWTDLTVSDAPAVRDFYREVVGWKPEAVTMGEYDDFSMTAPESGTPVAGVCHARGVNADLPSQWLVYITVDDVDHSAARCLALGGRVLAGPRDMGPMGRYAVIQDPAGAVAALFEAAT